MSLQPSVTLLNRRAVSRVLTAMGPEVSEIIRAAYDAYGRGKVVNPHSLFLLPPGPPPGRIIALPAGLFADAPAMGVKWIASFPENLDRGLERASALIILNDPATGYPTALLEGALISAWRTSRSASLAAGLIRPAKAGRTVSIIGCGVIARQTLAALQEDGWPVEVVALFDTVPTRADRMAEVLREQGVRVLVCASAADAAQRSDIVVFATTAPTPWFDSAEAFSHHPVVLHLSLRDIEPRLILDGQNFVDDVEHASRAGTSIELAAQRVGDHRFVAGTVSDLIAGRLTAASDRTAIFSPFGLGMLDIAVASGVAQRAAAIGEGAVFDDFFVP
jgi:2,3-diaminopropionate biosynthesis protein SbnB